MLKSYVEHEPHIPELPIRKIIHVDMDAFYASVEQLDHPEWDHVAALAGSTRHDELVDPDLSLEMLTWRLFHEESEVHYQTGTALSRGCRCSIAHFASVLGRFPES